MKFTQLVAHYGSIAVAARHLGYSTAILYIWQKKGIPLRTQKLIELDTNGKLKAQK